MSPNRVRQELVFEDRLVRHRIGFQVTPDVLGGIQLRRIGRQKLQAPVLFESSIALNTPSPMRHEPIPKQRKGTFKMPAQILQERKDLAGVDVFLRMKPEKQLDAVPGGRDGQGRDDRNLPITVCSMSEQWRLTARRPCPPHQRHHQKAALVDENERSPYASGVFFTRGQSILTQVWMAASSRSTARRCGFWGLQPRACKIRPIWST